ncbi:gfo/Idh/MocA family oxidoreductase, partial [candidate division KSB1 bacterium]
MNGDNQISRRQFVGALGASALFTIVPRHVLGGPGFMAPSDMLNIAGIGVGGMGNNNLMS